MQLPISSSKGLRESLIQGFSSDPWGFKALNFSLIKIAKQDIKWFKNHNHNRRPYRGCFSPNLFGLQLNEFRSIELNIKSSKFIIGTPPPFQFPNSKYWRNNFFISWKTKLKNKNQFISCKGQRIPQRWAKNLRLWKFHC